MTRFFEKLERTVKANHSRLCVGLDPRRESIPPPFRHATAPLFAFNKAVIDATAPYVCAYKPNFAFYEALGLLGIATLKKTIRHIPSEIPVIADAKRGDVGHTAEAYAKAIFEEFHCDAVTLNPFLGEDSLIPFLEYHQRGLYILCLTSNKGAEDFQLPYDLYLRIVAKVLKWNKAGNCGLVVGATHPEFLKKIRAKAPDLPLLLPGIGAQGGELAKAVSLARDSKGGGFIINVSRGITEPPGKGNFVDRVRQAAAGYRDAINKAKER